MDNVNEIREKIKSMSGEELEIYLKNYAHESAASVGDFIDYLNKNFDQDMKLCYIDCIEGCKYDATPVLSSDLGSKLFKYVRTAKSIMKKENMKDEVIDSFYPYVDDNDVIVI